MARLTFYENGKPCYRTKDYSPVHMKYIDTVVSGTPVATKLAAYEDAEEQGRLAVLPLKPGNAVYCVLTGTNKIIVRLISKIAVDFDWIVTLFDDLGSKVATGESIGKTVFLTLAEARAALAARRGGSGE